MQNLAIDGNVALTAQSWNGGDFSYTITQNGGAVYTGSNTLADGWQNITLSGVTVENGEATLGLDSASKLYMKNVQVEQLAAAQFIDATAVRTNRVPDNNTNDLVNAVNNNFAQNVNAGDKFYFDFMSDAAGKANLSFRLASGFITGGSDWGNVLMGDMPLADFVKITYNGEVLNLDGITLEGSEGETPSGNDWYLWRDIPFNGMDVKEGLNTFEVEFLRHEAYIDAVPEWITANEPEWGATFGANVDGLNVQPASSSITAITPCTVEVALGEISVNHVAADSLKLSGQDGKMTFSFSQSNGYTLNKTGYAADVSDEMFAEMLSAYLEGAMYYDLELYTEDVSDSNPRFTKSISAEWISNGKFEVSIDLSDITEYGRYGMHYGAASDNGDKNFTLWGVDNIEPLTVETEDRVYTVSYNKGEGEQYFFSSVGLTVSEKIAGTLNAARVSVNGASESQLIVWLDNEGAITPLEEGEYTVSGNTVVYKNNASLTATAQDVIYSYTLNDTEYPGELSFNLEERAEGVYLVFSAEYTVTEPSLEGYGAEIAAEIKTVADRLIENAVGAALSGYKYFDLEGNPHVAGALSTWNGRDVLVASSQTTLFTRVTGENKFVYEVNLSATGENCIDTANQTHYTLHFGSSNTSADYVTGKDIALRAQFGGKTYILRSYANGMNDGSRFWGTLGVIVLDEIKPVSMSIEGPSKTEYNIGEELDLAGLVVKATYNDGTYDSVIAEDGYTVSGFNKDTAGVQTVTVALNDSNLTATFEVAVNIVIAGELNAARVKVGDTASEELIVWLDNEGAITLLKEGDYIVSEDGNTVTHALSSEKTAQIGELVYAFAVEDGLKDGFSFAVETRLDSEGVEKPYLVLSVNYSLTAPDAAEEVLAAANAIADSMAQSMAESRVADYKFIDLQSNPQPAGALGSDYVNGYENSNVTFSRVEGETALEYVIELTNVVGDASHSHYTIHFGTTAAANFKIGKDFYQQIAAGDKIIAIRSYATGLEEGPRFWGNIGIIVLDEIKAVRLNGTAPSKTEYKLGEELDLSGMSITLDYNNGDYGVAVEEGAYTVSGFDSSSIGQKTVTISVNGTELEFNFTVNVNAYIAEKYQNYVNSGAYQLTLNAADTGVTHGPNVNPEDGPAGNGTRLGYFSGSDDWVEYKFALSAAAEVSFNWSVVGIGEGGNISAGGGVANLAACVAVEIDGVAVNLGAIGELTRTDDNYWDPIYNIVVEGVSLSAGEHTFRAYIITNGNGGVNIDGLTINSSQKFAFATKAPDFASDKPNSIELDSSDIGNGVTFITPEGVTDKPKDADSDYTGGIGSFDSVGVAVEYTFTMAEDGPADIVWKVAGSHWNGSGNSGIDALEGVIRLTIDGVEIDLSEVGALKPTDTADWWTVENVLIANYQLSAGTHTIRAEVLTNGSGVNIADLLIYADCAISAGSGQQGA